MAGNGFTVAPSDLSSAAATLALVGRELGTDAVAGGGGTGTGELDGALAALSARLEFVAVAMNEAIGATSLNLVAGAETYTATDGSQFRGSG